VTETAPSPQTPSVDAAATSAGPLGVPAAHAAAGGGTSPLDASFVAAYRAHFSYVWRSLARLGIRDADLPDATHDVFVVVHRKLADYDTTRPMKPWLFGICYRTALDRKRKMSSWREHPSDTIEAVAEQPGSDDLVQARQAHATVQRALATLDDDKRAVFVLHEIEGLTMPEVAQILEAPLNTLYSRLRLARAAFVAAVRAGGAG
jgi:RNA polymerase sigma-70 factor, ECF subfamily